MRESLINSRLGFEIARCVTAAVEEPWAVIGELSLLSTHPIDEAAIPRAGNEMEDRPELMKRMLLLLV